MIGHIKGIAGPTVRVDLKGLKLYDRVYVGHDMLAGEVVSSSRTGLLCRFTKILKASESENQ